MEGSEIPRLILFVAVISTTLIWTIVYFASWMTFPHKKALWHCFVVVLLHGIMSTILNYVIQMRADPWPFTYLGESSKV